MVIKRGRGRGGKGGQDRKKEPKERYDQRTTDSYGQPVESIQKNAAFEAYYIDQQILPQQEWSSFLTHLRTPLPTSFRITSGKATTTVLLDQLNNYYLPYLSNVQYEGERVPPPQSLPWYPEKLGWQIDVKKNALRKTEEFRKFQHFLVHETEVGNISRQESVSMIPPLFLDVKPHHIVLDMCAAPGSKTAQLIEAIHSPLSVSPETYDPCPIGLVIANDSDAKRAHMLIHQSQRLPSPNLVVANYDASHWPSIKVPYMAEGDSKVEDKVMMYDRILADVPCSGDGTIRKNLMVWKDWHPFNAASLHPLQLRILLRGLHNLRNGGRLVYSTCSMNPIENEAVVAAALRASGGTVSLVDQSDMLPELKRRKGLTSWKVYAAKGKPKLPTKDASDNGEGQSKGSNVDAYRQELPEMPYVEKWQGLDEELREKVPETLWPTGDEESLHLERCMRIYPHDQNTGGFFVAVLEKCVQGEELMEEGMAAGMVRAMNKIDADADALRASRKRPLSPNTVQLAAQPSKKVKEGQDEDAAEDKVVDGHAVQEDDSATAPDDKEFKVTFAGGTPYREDPMAYIDIDNEQSKSIVSFFGFSSDFNPRNLLVRNKEASPLRSIYLTSTSARALISSGGPGRGQHAYGNPVKMRLLNCGIRAFSKQESGKDVRLQCKWRVLSDGVPALRPFLPSDKIIKATLDDFAFLLLNHYPKIDDVPEGDFASKVKSSEMGSHFCDIQAGTWKGGHILHRNICVPIWRAAASLNVMLDRQEKSALSFRIFGKDLSNETGERQFASTAANNKKARQQMAKEEAKGTVLDEDALQELENAAAVKAGQPDDVEMES
jgi:multisite-specific tRNA:(cytosine-C5)-methyltransferase